MAATVTERLDATLSRLAESLDTPAELIEAIARACYEQAVEDCRTGLVDLAVTS